MVKTIQKIFAAVMVLCLSIASVPTLALAAEDSLITTVATTTNTVTDGEGNTIVTVTIEKETGGTTADGVTVDREESRSDTTKTDPDGNVLETSYVDQGIENREWDEDVKPGDKVPDVNVELKPGEITTGTATETTTAITGDVQQSPDDKNYDCTTTTTMIDRSVTAETSKANTTMNQVDTDLESIEADDYAGKDPNVIGPNLNFVAGTADTVPQPAEEGYDYQLVGHGDATNELKVMRDYITYKKVDGQPETDEDGNFIIEKIERKVDNTPMQIALRKDENGEYEYFFGYCIDSDTETKDGAWYKVSNLEDNDYYPDPDSAAKLRAIVTNGYWGTETDTGSLAQIRELIKQDCGADATITVDTDDKGGKATYKIIDIIDSLTEAEALAATQAAIWCFANGDSNTRDGKDGYIAHGPVNVYKPNPARDAYVREYVPESDARAMAVFNWLRSLDPIANTAEGVTTIINEKNAVSDMSLTVRDKVKDHADNIDANADNDVYNSDLNFTLAFVPDPEKDDLLVYLLDQDGNPIHDQDGNPIIKRLAGKNSEGRTADSIQPDENSVYTLTGLQLSENDDFKFDLRLEGTQYLKENVYIYTAHGGSDQSQSIVGIAEGTHTVDVSVGMTIKFEVNENKHVVAERSWHTQSNIEHAPSVPPATPTPPSIPSATPVPPSVPPAAVPVPPSTHPEEVPLHLCKTETVMDEEVHLADPVATGDPSFVLWGIAAAGAMGLVVICLLGRKAKGNEK